MQSGLTATTKHCQFGEEKVYECSDASYVAGVDQIFGGGCTASAQVCYVTPGITEYVERG